MTSFYRGVNSNVTQSYPPLRCSNVHTKFGEIIFSLILSNLELNSFYLWNRHQLDQTHLFDSVQLFMLILYSTRDPKPVGFVNLLKMSRNPKYPTSRIFRIFRNFENFDDFRVSELFKIPIYVTFLSVGPNKTNYTSSESIFHAHFKNVEKC